MAFRFALAGNPNSGKTTLFNELTGSNLHVGNWPGVTVERKEGICRYVYHDHNGRLDSHEHGSVHKHREEHNHITIIDLPGTYSLSPNSAEEVIARDFIIKEKPDLILNIVDATNLERNLYLTTQLAELERPMVIALNMMDSLEANGTVLDVEQLEKELGIPIVPISASKSRGLQDLTNIALEIARAKVNPKTEKYSYSNKFEAYIQKIKNLHGGVRLEAIKILEHDRLMTKAIKKHNNYLQIKEVVDSLAEQISDVEMKVAQARFQFIEEVLAKCISNKGTNKQLKLTTVLDKVFCNKYLAIPLFLVVMFAIFQITFGTIGSWLSDIVDNIVNVQFAGWIQSVMSAAGVADWANSLVVEGVISGVGAVISFFPQIMLLFFFLSFLEDSGYMARIAFIMDKMFVKIGLSGKSFVPMMMGFGCTVPAAMSTRVLENEKDRRLTLLLLPFMSCGAKMPIYAFISAVLFPNNAGLVIFALYLLGILLGVFSGLIFGKTLFRGKKSPFVLELPPYRFPTLKSTTQHMWEKAKDFIVRAGTILLLASVVIWFLQHFTVNFMPTNDNSQSILASLGRVIAPIFTWCGFNDWRIAVSLIVGVSAKEAVVSSLNILFGANADLTQVLTPVSAFAMLVFTLLYVPCIAAVTTISRELRSWKLSVFMVIYSCAIAWLVATVVYQIGILII